jgi:hypothetical protein
MNRTIPIVALAALFALQATVSFAAEPKIGNATSTKNNVQGILSGTSRNLSTGSDVYTNEVVRTSNASQADLKFLDDTNLSVGPMAEVRLDKFVYDPSGSSGAVVLHVTRGAFRFVTGSQNDKAYQIKTPFGTLGIRG